jgi:hypothetical protein
MTTTVDRDYGGDEGKTLPPPPADEPPIPAVRARPSASIIGATAVAFGLSVATRDTGSFAKIPGLEVEVWK